MERLRATSKDIVVAQAGSWRPVGLVKLEAAVRYPCQPQLIGRRMTIFRGTSWVGWTVNFFHDSYTRYIKENLRKSYYQPANHLFKIDLPAASCPPEHQPPAQLPQAHQLKRRWEGSASN